MSDLKNTAGTVLGAVNDVATTVSQTFNTATESVNMLNRFVRKAAQAQTDRYKLEAHSYRKNIINEAAIKQTLADEEIVKFLTVSEDRQKSFATHVEELNALFDD